MFTGLIEGSGRVVSLREGGMARIEVSAGPLAKGVNVGDSVAVNGTLRRAGALCRLNRLTPPAP